MEDDEIDLIDDESEDDSPDFYECFGCGYNCSLRPAFGGQCPKCGAHIEEGYF